MTIVGNFHPVLVHLPIGIFLFGFALELFHSLTKAHLSKPIRGFTLIAVVLSSWLSVISGLILVEQGSYEADSYLLHRNLGIAFALGSSALYFLSKTAKPWGAKLYLPAYSLLTIVLIISGHLGGSMTHGDGFLLGGSTETTTSVTSVALEEAKLYPDLVKPILDAKCVTCHRPGKTKGELDLSSFNSLVKGGEHGSVFPTAIDSLGTLTSRIHLSLDDKLHMPPKNKNQLQADEKTLLDWWIKSGYCEDCSIASMSLEGPITDALKRLTGNEDPLKKWKRDYNMVSEKWLAQVRDRGFKVTPVSSNHPMLIVSAKGLQQLASSDFKLLKKFGDQIVELDLAQSSMNNELAAHLSDFPNLLTLDVAQTAISDKAVSELSTLHFLKAFNAYDTKLTGAALEELQHRSSLEAVYLAQTEIKEADMAAFNKAHPNAPIRYIASETFPKSTLAAPTLEFDHPIFTQETKLAARATFKEAAIYYTIDQSNPDSTSTLYTAPISITQNATVRVIARLKGWNSSPIAEASFRKAAITPKEIKLLAKPHREYVGDGATTLIDLKRGSKDHKDGRWLGFEAVHTGVDIVLENDQPLKSITLSALSAPNSWIFFPAAIEVYQGERVEQLELVHRAVYEVEKPTSEVTQQFFDLPLSGHSGKHLRIVIKSRMKNPDWHASAGSNSWVFIDEILLN
ncbi:MAG: chitobiase/beta-hexosaminidase C-terminal domain-containing protein [Bacteroidetes bacterium]|nr:chitobiase/beta-hexosaminidase C-terminal domain-containing protein [Bacteroidota bacterium]